MSYDLANLLDRESNQEKSAPGCGARTLADYLWDIHCFWHSIWSNVSPSPRPIRSAALQYWMVETMCARIVTAIVVAISALVVGCGFNQVPPHFQSDNLPQAPRPSGSLAPSQITAAEQAVRAFLSALGRSDMTTATKALTPASRDCFLAARNTVRVAVNSLQILSARPLGTERATVLFRLDGRMRVQGASLRILPGSRGRPQWLVAAEIGRYWYVDPHQSARGHLLPLPLPCFGM